MLHVSTKETTAPYPSLSQKKMIGEKGKSMQAKQTTLARAVFCEGIGVHTNQKIRLSIHPASAHSGISFIRTDLPLSDPIPAHWGYVTSTTLCTVLKNGDAQVGTVEHLLAALSGAGISNAVIRLDGPEVPIMDGSADPFIRLIDSAGSLPLEAPRAFLKVLKPLRIERQDRYMTLTPAKEPLISFDCVFTRPSGIEDQSLSVTLDPNTFRYGIGAARSFGYIEDIELMQSKGLALGASLENAIALSSQGVVNPEGFRFDDECVRHKILDIVGDFTLVGMPILGHIHGHRSGHEMNYLMMKELFSSPENYQTIS